MLSYKVLSDFMSFIKSSEEDRASVRYITYSPRFYIAQEKVNHTDLLPMNGNN